MIFGYPLLLNFYIQFHQINKGNHFHLKKCLRTILNVKNSAAMNIHGLLVCTC